ncbi:hypothetical protein, partial [Enterobacter hormaechei]|nr:hypothetical protein [Enterobacter hormaechei]
MDENKLNIETVDGHNELVVSFLSRMVSLSDEEKQTVLSCLPDTGKQTITQLYGHCCKVSDEAAFCLIQRPYISKTLLT